MRIHEMGVQMLFDGNFQINREQGTNDYLFLYFHSECSVELHGETVEVTPPAVLIYQIGSKQHYWARGQTYMDDYVHFLFDESRSFIDELNLPVDTLIPLPENTVVPALLRQMYEEYVSINEFRETSMEYYFRLAMIKISELSERIRMAKVPARYDELFRNLRSEIYLNPARDWRVTECAENNGLSTPYFQKLYKSFFGNTFVQDVVRSRMEYAKHLLIMSSYSVKEIAALCGYRNET
ncbi:MAG: helix-turn-helix transcriptional regulator, partial [Lachnospiraceae bacterium]|nr:helix-turn-helix transcriptional regulator [Lachnospiraceae bacterium]